MLLPYFNLSYYLIGMFFGLMQYTVQKVMTEIEQNNYEVINLLEENNLLKDEEKKMIPNIQKINSDNKIFYDDNIFSFVNNKEKERLSIRKDLDHKLLDSKALNFRNASEDISNNLYTYKYKNDLLKNNNSRKIKDNDYSIDIKDSINDDDNDNIMDDKINDNKENIHKIIEIPFFKLTISIIKWHKKNIRNTKFFLTIIFIIFIIYFLLNYI